MSVTSDGNKNFHSFVQRFCRADQFTISAGLFLSRFHFIFCVDFRVLDHSNIDKQSDGMSVIFKDLCRKRFSDMGKITFLYLQKHQ
ncbi:CLUMA_CG000481, isoform A [Clunio marinus]|uniref:CLUMA_CG000481, isoform A n=1 Tax=Clunio marinus TaxID=568069 RepID=A0A1J1HF61_9DIPT|nr:CLUMA_CG000481, isoform A [Clunio marinus]